jgi:8-hydroxy-5-deazaflavin:NADPH oxidoreductase
VSALNGSRRVIGVIGGTGEQGRGLAYRLALAGHAIVIGSRSAERAEDVARQLAARAPGAEIAGGPNADAAAHAGLVIAAMPYEGHRELLEGLASELAGKIVIDCVNPLGFDKAGPYGIDPAAGSAAQEAAEVLPASTVVGAFHHVSAKLLLADGPLERSDVLVMGDDRDAKGRVINLIGCIEGMRGVDGGRLRLCRQVEHMTGVLIAVNRRYKCHAGLLVTDV